MASLKEKAKAKSPRIWVDGGYTSSQVPELFPCHCLLYPSINVTQRVTAAVTDRKSLALQG